MSSRLRFAPSPTGSLHVGNARTALINWLMARQAGGTLVLRIEDTDVERSETVNEETILADLAWMGIDWDEGPDVGGAHGPYRQSQRRASYDEAIRRLIEEGRAYPSFESAEKLAALRDTARRSGESLVFRGEHRDASAEQTAELLARGGAALRLRVADTDVRFVDGLRGETGLAAGEIGDFVIARADGSPTYNLAVVVDDHEMAVDQVVRGEDHLTNTTRQILLYQALGWEVPTFLHLPLVLGPDRSRLSKRHGATSVAEMRAAGVLPQALCNFLALLGWSPPGEEEVLGIDELMRVYDVTAMASANSVFDQTKLEWLNGQHIARLDPSDLLTRSTDFLVAAGIELPAEAAQRDWLARSLALVGIGARTLAELGAPLAALMYPPAARLVAAGAEARDDDQALAVLAGFAAASRAGRLADEAGYQAVVGEIKESTGAKGRGMFHPLRLAISGDDKGPELKQLVPLLEEGATLRLEPPVPSVAERIATALAAVD